MRELNGCRSKKRRVDAAVRQREAFLASVTDSLANPFLISMFGVS